jgi:hypothetical protein
VKEIVNSLNIRQKQAYAALCINQFCMHFNIRDNSISELITHLISLLTTDNIPEWESKGAILAIVGRGEPIPQNVIELVPVNCQEHFSELIENGVEVGIIDIYGALTEQPQQFLNNCIHILVQLKIEVPQLDGLLLHSICSNGWGDTIESEKLNEIVKYYGLMGIV